MVNLAIDVESLHADKNQFTILMYLGEIFGYSVY